MIYNYYFKNNYLLIINTARNFYEFHREEIFRAILPATASRAMGPEEDFNLSRRNS